MKLAIVVMDSAMTGVGRRKLEQLEIVDWADTRQTIFHRIHVKLLIEHFKNTYNKDDTYNTD